MQCHKDMRGSWKAESYHKYSDTQTLRLLTMKRSNGDLCTTVVLGTDTAGGGFMYEPFSDFMRTLLQTACRVTESRVREQHEKADLQVPALLLEAKAFYEKV